MNMIWQESLCLQWWGPDLWNLQRVSRQLWLKLSLPRQLVLKIFLLQLPCLGNLMRFWDRHLCQLIWSLITHLTLLHSRMQCFWSKLGIWQIPPQIEEALDEPLLKKLKVNFELNILLKENSAGEAELSPSKRSEPWAPEWYDTSGCLISNYFKCDLTQEYLLQPELLPGWASNESVLGI